MCRKHRCYCGMHGDIQSRDSWSTYQCLTSILDLATSLNLPTSLSIASYAFYNTRMDSTDPVYPPFSSSSQTNASNSQDFPSSSPRSANPDRRSTESTLASLPPTAAAGPSSLHANLAELPHPEPHLYSPTRAEIESHPIRQRLSLGRDEIATGYGSAPEATSENGSETFETGLLESRQAQEGSHRLFDAMSSEAPAVKEGDAGTFVLCPLGAALR